MGRVSDALKKAKAQREERLRVGIAQAYNQFGAPVVPSEPATKFTGDGAVATKSPGRGSESRIPVVSPTCDAERLSGSSRKSRRPAGLTVGEIINPTPVWDVHPTVVAVHAKGSPITEQYRAARTWLLRRYTPSKANSIAITSSMPREGKSVTTANLAVVMSEVRHMRVLAVDCDFRQGTLARLFKISNSPGLSDVLAGRAALEDAIQQTPLGNLYVLPGGTCHEVNSTELLNSTTAAKVFDELRERYEYTLVDTPPVQCLSDVGVIGALTSGIVLVVRMNKTPAHLVRQSAHWLQANNLNLMGCIAADCSAKGARYEYDPSHHD